MLEEQVHSKQGVCIPITRQPSRGRGTWPSNSKSAPAGLLWQEGEQGHRGQGAALQHPAGLGEGRGQDRGRAVVGKRVGQSQGPSSRTEAHRERPTAGAHGRSRRRGQDGGGERC